MDALVIRISPFQPDSFGDKIAWFIYATNSPFRLVQNKHHIDMVQLLRPGYIAPGRADFSGSLLNTVSEKKAEQYTKNTDRKFVNLSLDRWSDVHNPVTRAGVTTEAGLVYFTETINTSGSAHTAAYL